MSGTSALKEILTGSREGSLCTTKPDQDSAGGS